jgi:hypothetical protein
LVSLPELLHAEAIKRKLSKTGSKNWILFILFLI